jgi:hypothetical protein
VGRRRAAGGVVIRVLALAAALGLVAAACGSAPADPLPLATATPVPPSALPPAEQSVAAAAGTAEGGATASSPEAPVATATREDPDVATARPATSSTELAAPSPTPSAADAAADGDDGEAHGGGGPDAGDEAGASRPGGDGTTDDGEVAGAGAGGPDGGSQGETDLGARPTHAEVAAFVRVAVDQAGEGADHVVADVDGDDVPEVVVVAPSHERVRGAVWWWVRGSGYAMQAPVDAGPGTEVVRIGAGDLTLDGLGDLLVRVGGGARDSLALWSVDGPGEVSPLTAVGGCFDGSHVYGSTSAKLQSRPGGPAAILATCDDSPLEVADWSTAVYEFRDGAYRFVQQDRALPASTPVETVGE